MPVVARMVASSEPYPTILSPSDTSSPCRCHHASIPRARRHSSSPSSCGGTSGAREAAATNRGDAEVLHMELRFKTWTCKLGGIRSLDLRGAHDLAPQDHQGCSDHVVRVLANMYLQSDQAKHLLYSLEKETS